MISVRGQYNRKDWVHWNRNFSFHPFLWTLLEIYAIYNVVEFDLSWCVVVIQVCNDGEGQERKEEERKRRNGRE